MKRLTSLFLSLLMLLSLTACGGAGDVILDAALDAAMSAVQDYESSSSSGEKEFLPPEASSDHTSVALPGSSEKEDPSPSDTPQEPPAAPDYRPVEGGYYYDLENVVRYLHFYGELPDNYITKNEARDLGWQGGTPERFLEGSAIGGDKFGNREGLLPKQSGRSYTECDLNTIGADSRGAERLVFSNDGLYFYTDDHYETFIEVQVTDSGEVIW